VSNLTVAEVYSKLEGSKESFLEAFPHPVLVVAVGLRAAPQKATTKMITKTQVRPEKRAAAFLSPKARVLEVNRSGRQPFPIISIGRAASNDIVIDAQGVSKVHASLAKDTEGEWMITDSGSTNGTWIGGEKIKPHSSKKLANGEELILGNEVTAIFLLPEGLYGWARLTKSAYVKNGGA
jgi:hypothetical protein